MFSEISRAVKHTMKWIKAIEIQYRDPKGIHRTWECVERTTGSHGLDAVDIVATLQRGGDRLDDAIVLISQYRPPLGLVSVEFPAGLVDRGETAASAAVRELKEETGYTGHVIRSSPPLSHDPGLLSTKASMVIVTIDALAPENQEPKQLCEEDEFITVHVVPKRELTVFLQKMTEKGCCVYGKVWAFAEGLQM